MKRKKISIDTDPTQIVTDRGRSARTALGLRTRKSPASHITQSTHLTPSSAHLLGCECNNRLHCAQLIVPKNLRVTRCTQQHPPTYSTLQMEIRLDILPKVLFLLSLQSSFNDLLILSPFLFVPSAPLIYPLLIRVNS